MQIKSPLPVLPALYELEVVDDARRLTDYAVSQARAGVEEGRVLFASHTPAGTNRNGRWHVRPDNLDITLLLRPEFNLARTRELILVASLSLGRAAAALAEPMTPLQYGWPNDLVMAGLKAGSVWLDTDTTTPEAVPEWAVITVSVNVNNYPEDIENAVSMRWLGGELHFTVADLCEEFCKQFLSWINRWAEEGLDVVTNSYASRIADENDVCAHLVYKTIKKNPTEACSLSAILPDGSVRLSQEAESNHSDSSHKYRDLIVTLDDWYHWQQAHEVKF